MTVITVSRQMCSLGDEIANILSKQLGARLVNRDTLLADLVLFVNVPLEQNLLAESPKYYCAPLPGGGTLKEMLEDRLRCMAQDTHIVVVGLGSQAIFAGDPQALHIRTVASLSARAKRLTTEYHVSAEEAQSILSRADRKHKRYVSLLYGIDSTDPAHYDITFHTDTLTANECALAVVSLLDQRNLAALQPGNPTVFPAKAPIFKNSSEEEFARILDMYQMQWEYEPKTFPVEWDAEGNVTMAISPDFYLPRFDTYIEITTMNQKYVTTKNKKIRKLRELYPAIQIRIVYKNDFNALIDRFKTSKGAE